MSPSSRALDLERRLQQVLGLSPRDVVVDKCIELGIDAFETQLVVELTKLHLAFDGGPIGFDQLTKAIDEAKGKVLSYLKG